MNGHIGFNEPRAVLTGGVHVETLDAMTLRHPMVQQSADVHFGITMGLDAVLHSREIMMLANGAKKAPLFRQLVRGEISSDFPASYICTHPQAFIFADKAATTLV